MRGDVALRLEHELEHELWQSLAEVRETEIAREAEGELSRLPRACAEIGAEIGAELQLGGAWRRSAARVLSSSTAIRQSVIQYYSSVFKTHV